MSEPTEVPARSRRTPLLIAGAAVIVLLLVAAIWSRAGAVGSAPTASSSTEAAALGPTASTVPTSDVVASPGASAAASPSQGSGVQAGPVPVPPLGDVPPVVGDGSNALAPRDGVAVRLVTVAPVTTSGTGPGEVSGAGLAVTVEVANRTSSAVDLTSSDVTLYVGTAGTPAATVTTDPSSAPFPDQVAAGAAVQGTFVFATPNDPGTLVAVQVSLGGSAAPVVFQTAVRS